MFCAISIIMVLLFEKMKELFKLTTVHSVGIATRYGLDDSEMESRWGARFSAPVQTGPEDHPASYTVGTGSSPVVKRPVRGVDNTHPHLAPRLKKQ